MLWWVFAYLDYVMEHLDEAQFDVEFGRQDLAGLRAAARQARVAVLEEV